MSAARRRRGRLLAAALAVTALFGLATPAAAEPGVPDARARAAALHAQVEALQVQTEALIEKYDATESALGNAVTAHLLAEQQLEAAQADAAQQAQQVADRVRALYMAGGEVSLLATVLDGTSPDDVFARVRDVQSIVSVDVTNRGTATGAVREAAAIEHRLARLAERRTSLQVAAARAADQVRAALARQQALLDAADAEVRRLVAATAAATQGASAEDFRRQLAAARSAAGLDPHPASEAAPDPAAARAIEVARTKLGSPYVWGGSGPDVFDCSGLTQWSYAHAGVTLPRVAADQWDSGPHPTLAELAPGDLLFWATDTSDPTTIYHEGLYIGGGQMIVAPHTGDVVKVQDVYAAHFIGATRPTASLAAAAAPETGVG